MMRFAIARDVEIDGGKRRCGLRVSAPHVVRQRAIDIDPHDAAKAVSGRAQWRGEAEPHNAAKGEQGAASRGAIQC